MNYQEADRVSNKEGLKAHLNLMEAKKTVKARVNLRSIYYRWKAVHDFKISTLEPIEINDYVH